jgi:hypothetical protein
MGMFDWFGSSPQPSGSPSSAQAKAPPPPTTQNASATSPTQDCPLHAKHPCSINKLMIKVTGIDPEKGEEKPPFKLETTKVRRFEAVTDVQSKAAVALLKQVDLLIDVIAEPNDKKPAEIEGRAYYTSPDCETQSHPLLTLTPRGSRDVVILKKVGASEIDMPSHKFPAMKSYLDDLADQKQVFDNAATVLKIIESFIESIAGHVTQVDVRADACGKRARGDGGNLNMTLIAQTRIFRRSKWAIGIKIPPIGKFEAKKERELNVKGITTTTSSTEKSSAIGGYKSEDKTTQSGVSGTSLLNSSEHETSTQWRGQVDSRKTSQGVEDGSPTRGYEIQHSDRDGHKMDVKDGHVTSEEIKKRLEAESGFDVIISIDDREIEVGEALKKVKEQVAKIIEAITDIQKLLAKVPQVGWKFTFEVSVFAGTITCECAPEYVAGPKANGRYYPVQHKFKGKIEVKLFDVSITVSFGVDAQVLDSGLVLKIDGKISLECSVEKEINLDFFNPRQEFEVKAEANAKLEVVGYVSLLGKTLADAELSVSSGLEFKGKFEADLPERKFHLGGKLKTKKILLNGKVKCPYWWDKKIDPPKELLPERELCSLE